MPPLDSPMPFAGYTGFGTSIDPADAQNVNELYKAMTSGTGVAVPGSAVPGAVAPVMPEDLQYALVATTYQQTDAIFWRMLQPTTRKATNNSVQWTDLQAYAQGNAIFMNEVGLAVEQDSTYTRRLQQLKIMGVGARVSILATQVQTIGFQDLVAQETLNKTAYMVAGVENALFNGNSAIIPEEFDGLERQVALGGGIRKDARGGLLTLATTNAICGAVRQSPNYGRVDHIFCSIQAFSDILNDFAITNSVLRGELGKETAIGSMTDTILTQHGVVKVVPDVFIVEGQPAVDAGYGPAALAPLAPSLGGAITPAPTAGSQFAAPDAGTYIYKVVAINKDGFSPALITAGVTVASGDGVPIPVVQGSANTTGYIVYRSTLGGAASTALELFRVAKTGATQTITDLNAALPGTSKAFFVSFRPEWIQWAELFPLSKIDLALIDTSKRWFMYMIGGLLVKSPRRHAVLYNVGVSAAGIATVPDFNF